VTPLAAAALGVATCTAPVAALARDGISGPPAISAEAARPPQPEAARNEDVLADARAVVEVLGFDDRIGELITIYRNTLVTNASVAFGRPAADIDPIADVLVVPALRAHRDELLDAFASIWRSNLSSYDIHDLRVRLASEDGRRLSLSGTVLGNRVDAAMPRILAQETEASNRWGQRVANAAIAANPEFMRAHGFVP
jgi:hypothetical protein